MLIVSKAKNQIVNIDESASIFANSERRIIAMLVNGRNMIIDEYSTREEALKAMELLAEKLRVATEKTTVCFMPTDEEVEKALTGQREYYHHINGKKTKGHGGS